MELQLRLGVAKAATVLKPHKMSVALGPAWCHHTGCLSLKTLTAIMPGRLRCAAMSDDEGSDGSQGIKGSIVLSSTICSTILDQWASLRSKRQTFTELVPNSIAGDPGLEGATCAAQKGYTAVTLGWLAGLKKYPKHLCNPFHAFHHLPSLPQISL